MKQVQERLGVSYIFKCFQNPEALNKCTQTLTHKFFSIPVASGRNVFHSQATPLSCTSLFLSVAAVASRQEGHVTGYNMFSQVHVICAVQTYQIPPLYTERHITGHSTVLHNHFLSYFLENETVVLHHSCYCICSIHAAGVRLLRPTTAI